MKQEAPFCVQIEPTEGCNLACTFCGIHGIRQPGREWRTFNFMTVQTMERVVVAALRAKWNPRWEFAMHGEPTLNPALADLVRVIRVLDPKAYILLTTNALPTVPGDTHAARVEQARQFMDDIYGAGVNTIALDDYEYVKGKSSAAFAEASSVPTYEYPQDGPPGNPHKRHRGHKLSIVQDISVATAGTHSHLANHAGSALPADPSDRRASMPCAKPFREISVRWDGSIAVCCNDWRGEYVVGNVNQTPIDELWQSERFMAARRRLLIGQRDMRPCHGCTHTSDRPGLLPDKMGKQRVDYPAPMPEDEATIAAALAAGPLTAPVFREWEDAPTGAKRNPLPMFTWKE